MADASSPVFCTERRVIKGGFRQAVSDQRRDTKLTVAVFFAFLGESQLLTTKRGPEPQALVQHLQQINLMFRSLRRFHPEARAVLLTDDATPTTGLDRVEVVRAPIDASRLIWHRLLARRGFTESLRVDELCLFLDGDILINRPLTPLYAMDGDVLLTWRRGRKFVNAGVIGVRGAARERALYFFDRVQSTYRERFWHNAGWGDQDAVAETLANVVVQPERTVLHNFEGFDVMFLPGSLWNWSPVDTRFSAILWPKTKAYVLHFKGRSRRLMEPYWRLYGQPSRSHERARLWAKTLLRAAADQFVAPSGSNARWRTLRSRVQRGWPLVACRHQDKHDG